MARILVVDDEEGVRSFWRKPWKPTATTSRRLPTDARRRGASTTAAFIS